MNVASRSALTCICSMGEVYKLLHMVSGVCSSAERSTGLACAGRMPLKLVCVLYLLVGAVVCDNILKQSTRPEVINITWILPITPWIAEHRARNGV